MQSELDPIPRPLSEETALNIAQGLFGPAARVARVDHVGLDGRYVVGVADPSSGINHAKGGGVTWRAALWDAKMRMKAAGA